jgi:hypothetical protein
VERNAEGLPQELDHFIGSGQAPIGGGAKALGVTFFATVGLGRTVHQFLFPNSLTRLLQVLTLTHEGE